MVELDEKKLRVRCKAIFAILEDLTVYEAEFVLDTVKLIILEKDLIFPNKREVDGK